MRIVADFRKIVSRGLWDPVDEHLIGEVISPVPSLRHLWALLFAIQIFVHHRAQLRTERRLVLGSDQIGIEQIKVPRGRIRRAVVNPVKGPPGPVHFLSETPVDKIVVIKIMAEGFPS